MSESGSIADRWFMVPVLTRKRIWFAFAVAILTDGLQMLLGPLGWPLVDEVLDVAAMVLITSAIGFHPLLLPTFVAEFIPVVDMLPTWVGCTTLVVVLRRRTQPRHPPVPPVPPAVSVDPAPPRPQAPPKLLKGPEA